MKIKEALTNHSSGAYLRQNHAQLSPADLKRYAER